MYLIPCLRFVSKQVAILKSVICTVVLLSTSAFGETFSAGAAQTALSTILTSCINCTNKLQDLAKGRKQKIADNFPGNLPVSHQLVHNFQQEIWSQSDQPLLHPAIQNKI